MDNPKFELNGCLIDVKQDRINFIATDTRRLALTSISNSSLKEIAIIIPKKAIIELQKLFFNELNIFLNDKVLIVKSSNFKFFTKLINGKFPKYERIIPSQLKQKIELNKDMVIEKLKQVSIISQEIKITIKNQNILFENLHKENAEAKSSCFINNQNLDEIIIKTTSRYIVDFLSNIEGLKYRFGIF